MNEHGLKNAFVRMLDVLKMQTEQIASLMTEVGAIRDTVQALDPTFSETFDIRRREVESRTLRLVYEQIAHMNELTRRINAAGEIF